VSDIGSRGVIAISHALETNKSLKVLSMGCNRLFTHVLVPGRDPISEEAMIALSRSLP
jgi:hypothetical protein